MPMDCNYKRFFCDHARCWSYTVLVIHSCLLWSILDCLFDQIRLSAALRLDDFGLAEDMVEVAEDIGIWLKERSSYCEL